MIVAVDVIPCIVFGEALDEGILLRGIFGRVFAEERIDMVLGDQPFVPKDKSMDPRRF